MTIFALYSSEAGLVLERAGDALLWRHLGLPVETTGLPPLARTRGAATFSLDEDMPFATAPGLGWFGPLAVSVAGRVLRWAVTDVAADADSLRFTLTDADTGLLLEQCFRLAPGGGFAISATMGNNGPVPIAVDHLASALLPLPAGLDRVLSWRGRHAAEFVESVEPLPAHQWRRETRRGLPGHGGPPGLYLLGQGADWDQGLVLAAQLAWSGDAALAVERDDDGRHVLSAGAADGFTLQPGERFEAPPLLLAISGQGRNGAMQQMHGLVRARLDWPGQAMRPRPVHLNSWEACYFRHDEARILGLARAAAAIGVERFILDDGWFLGRNHDHAGLGDWTADPAKYPDGLKPLAQGVNALGLEFGLWVEPEMVNPDSDLYRTHPDWALHVPSAPQPTARNQLVLNLSLPAVEDYLFAALDTLLSDVPIAYLKWDHNRELAPAGGLGQVQGLYRLLARLRAAHPHVEIESCAGGGGRIDAGIAAFAHRFWTSDNLDAVSRATIQRGFQAFFQPELMGAHVGASPAHATGRARRTGRLDCLPQAVATPAARPDAGDGRRAGRADVAGQRRWCRMAVAGHAHRAPAGSPAAAAAATVPSRCWACPRPPAGPCRHAAAQGFWRTGIAHPALRRRRHFPGQLAGPRRTAAPAIAGGKRGGLPPETLIVQPFRRARYCQRMPRWISLVPA